MEIWKIVKVHRVKRLQANIAAKTSYYLLLVCLALPLMISCTTSSSAPPETTGKQLSAYPLKIDVLGTKSEFLVDSQGKLKTKINLSSADNGVNLSLNEGAMLLDKDKKPLQTIHVAIDPSPPPSPDDAYTIGAVYDFSPHGANFNPQIKLSLSYNLEELPEGVRETDIYIAYYQDTEWKKLLYKNIDTERHKITTQIEHFARFAVLAPKEHPTSETPSAMSSAPADRVEIVYFHRTNRCRGCIYAEEGTRYTLETYFKDELASSKITLKVLNVEDKENAPIVKKYGAFTSSLFINTVIGNTDNIEEVTDIWLFLGNDKAFVEVVKNKIKKSLKGTG